MDDFLNTIIIYAKDVHRSAEFYLIDRLLYGATWRIS